MGGFVAGLGMCLGTDRVCWWKTGDHRVQSVVTTNGLSGNAATHVPRAGRADPDDEGQLEAVKAVAAQCLAVGRPSLDVGLDQPGSADVALPSLLVSFGELPPTE